jgi:glutathione peroxidase
VKCGDGKAPEISYIDIFYSVYSHADLEILAFPANEFLTQEPGTNEEIQSFCSLNYNVTFPVNQKIVVKGEAQHPLYKELTDKKAKSIKEENSQFEDKLRSKGLITGEKHDILWNFEKFLLDQSGHIVERFAPDVSPQSELIKDRLLSILQ